MKTVNEIIQPSGESFIALGKSILEQIRVAIPGFVIEFNAVNQTVSVQPSVMEKREGKNVQLPILTDIPVYFPGGNTNAITYKVSPGDECLVIFSDTNIDAWFESGMVSVSQSRRRHSLSDGFALVGFRSSPNTLPNVGDDFFAVHSCVNGVWSKPLYVDSNGVVHGGGGGCGSSDWDTISNKPFSTLGTTLKVTNGVLDVNTANSVQQDNTLPVTSAAVFMEIGNIEALLDTI